MQLSLFDDLFVVSEHKNISEEVNKIFNYYRSVGFPNYNKEYYSIVNSLNELLRFDETSIFDKNKKEIDKSMVGLGSLWSYFPHWIEVKYSNQDNSLIELWNNDSKLKELIKKTYLWKIKHNEKRWTHNRIRQNAKVYLLKQSVSNFRPSVAKFIYNKYGNKGSVLDMSCGYGGRLLGFFSSKCNEYVGFEPCYKTFIGLNSMKDDLLERRNKRCNIINDGVEIYHKDFINHFDLCFSSPPYFDTEKYSEEDSQSYKKYPTLDLWINGFLHDMISNCYKYLKKDRYMIINIANTPKYKLEEPTIDIAKKIGFFHVDTLWMVLSSIAGKGKKYEPIFVFKKMV